MNFASFSLGTKSHWSLVWVPPSTTLSWLSKKTKKKIIYFVRWIGIVNITLGWCSAPCHCHRSILIFATELWPVKREQTKNDFPVCTVRNYSSSNKFTRKMWPRIGWTKSSLTSCLAPNPVQLTITSKSEAISSRLSRCLTTTTPLFERNFSIKCGSNLDPSQI